MPLIPIERQPIKMFANTDLEQYNPGDIVAESFCPDCANETVYCQKFATNDTLAVQMRNEPVLNPDFNGCTFGAWTNDWGVTDTINCGVCCGEPKVSPILSPDWSLPSIPGMYYLITFELRNVESGGVYLEAETGLLLSDDTLFFNQNGFYAVYVFPTATTRIRFRGTDDWVGCLYNLKVQEQCRSHRAFLYDTSGNQLADISSLINYDLNWLTIGGLMPAYVALLTAGRCYNICIVSTCGGFNGSTEANNILGDPFFFDGEWIKNNSTAIFGGSPSLASGDFIVHTIPTIDLDKCYRLELRIDEVLDAGGDLYISIGGNLVFSGTVTTPGVIVLDGLTFASFANTDFVIQFAGGTGITLQYIYFAVDVACQGQSEMDYCSSCMQYLGDEGTFNDCMVMVKGGMMNQIPGTNYNPSTSYGLKMEAFGFLWVPYFNIMFRELFVFHNPHEDGVEEKYRYSIGHNKRTSGSLESIYDVSIGQVDWRMHQSVSLLLKLDWMQFKQSALQSDQTLYTGNETDYQPNWAKQAKTVTSQGRFEVKKLLRSAKYLNNVI